MPDQLHCRMSVDRWTRDTDETFQELTLEDISDSIKQVAKAKGPKELTTQLMLGTRRVEIVVRRVQ